MNPINVIIWTCVAIFIVTGILTLLHISGIRTLPNEGHGRILFKALIVEVVVIAVSAFASNLLPKDEKQNNGGLPGSMADNQGIFLSPPKSDKSPPLLQKSGDIESSHFQNSPETSHKDENCHQITVSDSSVFPPTSRIETICDK